MQPNCIHLIRDGRDSLISYANFIKNNERIREPVSRILDDLLYGRIETRVHRMYESGLMDEVARLAETYPSLSDTAAQANEAWEPP